MIARLLRTPCTITVRTAGSVDGWGNPATTETTRTTYCHVNEGNQAENVAPEHRAEAGATVYLAADDPVTEHDSITVDGREFEVTGPPVQRRRAPTGEVHHLEVPVQEVR
jgi:hypothetical protein